MVGALHGDVVEGLPLVEVVHEASGGGHGARRNLVVVTAKHAHVVVVVGRHDTRLVGRERIRGAAVEDRDVPAKKIESKLKKRTLRIHIR